MPSETLRSPQLGARNSSSKKVPRQTPPRPSVASPDVRLSRTGRLSSGGRSANPQNPTPSPFDSPLFQQFSLNDRSPHLKPRKLEDALSDNDSGEQQKAEKNIAATSTKNRVVYLIRHGESQGQMSGRNERKNNSALLDCRLTANGRAQARRIPKVLGKEAYDSIQCVITSPLTRAVETAVLGFAVDGSRVIPILCHYDLREIGGGIPENVPRKTADVLNDIQEYFVDKSFSKGSEDNAVADSETISAVSDDALQSPSRNTVVIEQCNKSSTEEHAADSNGVVPYKGKIHWKNRIDFVSLRPHNWPHRHETPPKVIQRDRIRNVFSWLADMLPDHVLTIAVVCHYHVIRSALADPYAADRHAAHGDVRPENATPICCELTADGSLLLKGIA